MVQSIKQITSNWTVSSQSCQISS